MKRIAITGSTGFIAGRIISQLEGYSFILLKRRDFSDDATALSEKLRDADIVINLAGAPIIKRWTARNMEEIYNSRILTTRKLVKAMELVDKDIHLISASAIGIYDSINIHNESSRKLSAGFAKDLLEDWEAEAGRAKTITNSRVSIIRIGLVISRHGGIMKRLKPLFKMGLGGTIGTGQQFMSFIHIDDMMNAIEFIIEKKLEGIINLTAPEPVNNKEFTKSLGKILRMPAFLKVPVFMLKLAFGKGAETIISGQLVAPGVLMAEGFTFIYPDINSTLKNIIESS